MLISSFLSIFGDSCISFSILLIFMSLVATKCQYKLKCAPNNVKTFVESIRLIFIYRNIEWIEESIMALDSSSTDINCMNNIELTIIDTNNTLIDLISIGQYLGEMHQLTINCDDNDIYNQSFSIELAIGWIPNLLGILQYLKSIDGDCPPKCWTDERQDIFEQFLWTFIVPRIARLDKWIGKYQKNGRIPGFMFGSIYPCWVDFYVYTALRIVQTIPGAWIKGQFYVWIEQFFENIDALPRVGEYITQRIDIPLMVNIKRLIILPPYRNPAPERAIRTQPTSGELESSDEDQRVIIPKWDMPDKEKRRKKRADERASSLRQINVSDECYRRAVEAAADIK